MRRGVSPSAARAPIWMCLAALAGLATLPVLVGTARAPAETGAAFEFALIGDQQYGRVGEAEFPNLIAEINAAPVAFVIHDGDFKAGAGVRCTDDLYFSRLADFQASLHPFVYTPGDNEWQDCARNSAGGYEPAERLAFLRRVFFPDEFSLGQQRIRLTRQSESGDPRFTSYVENARWTFGEITFITIHVIGDNNNYGYSPQRDAEWAERTGANLAWLREGFELARDNRSRGVVVVQQANPLFEEPRAGRMPFNDVLDTLEDETIRFGKPVALVHGDTHYYRVDKPLMAPARDRLADNFTRVETFGAPNSHWVHVAVDYGDPNLFVFTPKIVAANRAFR